MLAGYSSERKLAGIVGLSGWLPLHNKFAAVLIFTFASDIEMRTDANLKTPLFMAHGDEDMVVNFRFGQMSYERLQRLGADVEFHKIEDMAHEAQPEELRLLETWLKAKLPKKGTANEGTDKEGAEVRGNV